MNTVRITSGKYRGRKIATPGGATHPMGDRERLALFNMISSYLDGAKVLDAFAGSGALGIEALSRGAGEVTFLEKNTQAARVIRDNLKDLQIKADVVVTKASNYDSAEVFDVIIADPPYDDFELTEVTSLIKHLKSGGVFVLSHPDKTPEIDELTLIKTNQYAGAHLSIYLAP